MSNPIMRIPHWLLYPVVLLGLRILAVAAATIWFIDRQLNKQLEQREAKKPQSDSVMGAELCSLGRNA
jgi:hypothetical protein